MRKILLTLIFLTLNKSVFSLFDVAIDGGYISTAATDISTLGTTNLDGTGYIVNGAGHFNFGIPAILTFGVGTMTSLTRNSVAQQVSTNPETIAYSGFLITGGVMLSF